MTQVEHVGDGAVEMVGEALDDLAARRVLLVTGRSSFHSSGAAAALAEPMARRDVTRFSEFEVNPKLSNLQSGLELLSKSKPDVVLAVGGGSAIDMAKLLALCVTQEAKAEEIVTGAASIDRPSAPVIAVPTTAGTGSEATHFAVIYVDGRKRSVAAPAMLPAWAIVDPRLTATMPPKLTAETGLDALSQAMESLWSIRSTRQSRFDARYSLTLARSAIEAAVHSPDADSRRAMAQAAHSAGRAINISFTTAPHALSYALTSRFGVPHGLAVALTLGQVLMFNAGVSEVDVADPRGVNFVRDRVSEIVEIIGGGNASGAAAWLNGLLRTLGLPDKLHRVGIEKKDLNDLARAIDQHRLGNNPRVFPAATISTVLAEVF